jgi:hypothetical protein
VRKRKFVARNNGSEPPPVAKPPDVVCNAWAARVLTERRKNLKLFEKKIVSLRFIKRVINYGTSFKK